MRYLKNSQIFFPQGPRENVSPGAAVAFNVNVKNSKVQKTMRRWWLSTHQNVYLCAYCDYDNKAYE